MNPHDPRKAISKIIRDRLADGENKEDIFAYLQSEFNATDISSGFLAQWPYPAERKKHTRLNNVLLIILVIIAIFKIVSSAMFIWQEIPKAIPMIVIIPLINIFLIYKVARFNGMGYTLTVLLSGAGGLKVWDDFPDSPTIEYIAINGILSALLLSSALLAEVQRRRLFPNSTFFMRPKKNEDGDYIF